VAWHTTDSPLVTLSPGDFSQDTIFPSVMVELSAGMKTSLTAATTVRPLLRGGLAICGLDTAIGAVLHPATACLLCIATRTHTHFAGAVGTGSGIQWHRLPMNSAHSMIGGKAPPVSKLADDRKRFANTNLTRNYRSEVGLG